MPVVATTGTAVYGHALRKGGTKIAERLGPDTVDADEADKADSADDAVEAESERVSRTQAGIALTPEAEGLAGAIARATSAEPSRTPPPPKTGYRKSIALAVAMLAVFGAAIAVGLLAGGPIRQAGTGYNFTRPQSVTRGPSATPSTGSPTATATTSTNSSPSASTSAAATSGSAPAPSSDAAATNQGTASQAPTG